MPSLKQDSKYNAAKYDLFYNNSQAKKENTEIKRLFNLEFDENEWIDVGCGTGFGYTLMPVKSRYLGVDIDPNMVYACNSKHKGRFICGDAENQSFKGNILSIFSVNYFKVDSIVRLASQSKNAFVVFYNKPYLKGSASVYCNMESEYLLQHEDKSKFIYSVFNSCGFKISKLLNEPFYYVGVKHGNRSFRRYS